MAHQPDDVEREFGIEELFFSTTDLKGHITAGNAVFARVSGYSEEELLGRAHNIVRHPDMPRAVFQLLWDTIAAGQPIAAYVKNRAKDGRPYWVMASVVPVAGGYLSVRLKPSSPLFEAVKPIYRALLELEQEVEARSGRKRAIAASVDLLGELLAGAGFADYAAFMHTALPAEARSRDLALLARHGLPTVERSARHPAVGESGEDFLDSCTFLFGYLRGLFEGLAAYSQASERLRDKSAFVLDLADEIQLFSLNAVIASARLDDAGATLSTVAALMREHSGEISELLQALSRDIVAATRRQREVEFAVSLVRLQTETAADYGRELQAAATPTGHATGSRTQTSVQALSDCLATAIPTLMSTLEDLETQLARVRANVGALMPELSVLRALHTKGRIESAAGARTDSFHFLLEEIGNKITAAGNEIADLRATAATVLMRSTDADRHAVREHHRRIQLLAAGT